MTPNIFVHIFAYVDKKNDFKSVAKIEKMNPELFAENFCQTFVKVEKSSLFHTFLGLAPVCSIEICVVLIPIFTSCKENIPRLYSIVFETLKPNSQHTAQNTEKCTLFYKSDA